MNDQGMKIFIPGQFWSSVNQTLVCWCRKVQNYPFVDDVIINTIVSVHVNVC